MSQWLIDFFLCVSAFLNIFMGIKLSKRVYSRGSVVEALTILMWAICASFLSLNFIQ